MNIVFLGSGAFALPSLQALARSQHKILHVVSQPDRPAGRGKHLTPTPVSQWAIDHGVPLTRTENANSVEILEQLRALKADAMVVIAFGQKLSDELLAIVPHVPINLHSSLLPKYRGAAPINWAVINNDAVAGVCVIEVTAKLDAGDVLAEASTPIGASETAGELHDRLAELGSPLLPGVLDQLAENAVVRVPQDALQATRAPKLSREMAWVDFTKSAEIVSARIRGLSPWPAIQVQLVGADRAVHATASLLKCQVTNSSASHAPEKCGVVLADLSVACGTGSVQLLTLQPQNKKAMDLRSFANGHPFVAGARIRSVVGIPLSS